MCSIWYSLLGSYTTHFQPLPVLWLKKTFTFDERFISRGKKWSDVKLVKESTNVGDESVFIFLDFNHIKGKDDTIGFYDKLNF